MITWSPYKTQGGTRGEQTVSALFISLTIDKFVSVGVDFDFYIVSERRMQTKKKEKKEGPD